MLPTCPSLLAGVIEPGAPAASIDAARQVLGYGSMGSGSGSVSGHLPVRAQAAADHSIRLEADTGVYLDQDTGPGQELPGMVLG